MSKRYSLLTVSALSHLVFATPVLGQEEAQAPASDRQEVLIEEIII